MENWSRSEHIVVAYQATSTAIAIILDRGEEHIHLRLKRDVNARSQPLDIVVDKGI